MKSINTIDLDSYDSQKVFKKYLYLFEELCVSFKIDRISIDYRKLFARPYNILLGSQKEYYLFDVMIRAYKNYPFLCVNSEKYLFSKDVIKHGNDLFTVFLKLRNFIKDFYYKFVKQSD